MAAIGRKSFRRRRRPEVAGGEAGRLHQQRHARTNHPIAGPAARKLAPPQPGGALMQNVENPACAPQIFHGLQRGRAERGKSAGPLRIFHALHVGAARRGAGRGGAGRQGRAGRRGAGEAGQARQARRGRPGQGPRGPSQSTKTMVDNATTSSYSCDGKLPLATISASADMKLWPSTHHGDPAMPRARSTSNTRARPPADREDRQPGRPQRLPLFYGDELARPGADLTFFEYPLAKPGRPGAGMVHGSSGALPQNRRWTSGPTD